MPVAPDTSTAMPSTSSSAHASTPPYTRPGEPLCCGPNVHRACTSTGVGRAPGRRLLRAVDPLDRWCLRVEPTGAGLGEALHPAVGVTTQEHRVGSLRGAQRAGEVGELGDGLRAHVGVDVGHDHRRHEVAGRGDEVERGVGEVGRIGERVAGELGDPRGGDGLVHLADVTQDR